MGCKRCGQCCKELTIRVPLVGHTDVDIQDFLKYLQSHRVLAFRDMTQLTVLIPHLCANLDYKENEGCYCKDYDNRSEICKQFLCQKAREE